MTSVAGPDKPLLGCDVLGLDEDGSFIIDNTEHRALVRHI